MSCKSICDKCIYRWSSGGKLYCMISNQPSCKYSINKKECPSFKEGPNDKIFRKKVGHNRKGRCW